MILAAIALACSITVSEGAVFDRERACAIYDDLASHHFPKLGEKPALSFIIGKLDCNRTRNTSRASNGKILACMTITPWALEIQLPQSDDPKEKDDPAVWLPLVTAGLDYHNRAFLDQDGIQGVAKAALDCYYGKVHVDRLKERN